MRKAFPGARYSRMLAADGIGNLVEQFTRTFAHFCISLTGVKECSMLRLEIQPEFLFRILPGLQRLPIDIRLRSGQFSYLGVFA